jgi:glucose-6-phosphate 1-epimerase
MASIGSSGGAPLAGNINVALGRGEVPTATLTHAQSGASCEVVLMGAHVTSWRTADGVERLFVSSKSKFGNGAAIRGGIPVCWPQFAGRGPLPKHGFARTSDAWEIETMSSDDTETKLALCLKDTEASRAAWPHGFQLRYAVTLTATTLTTALEITNTGTEELTFTGALHTYFAVPDVGTVRVVGLNGLQYEDNANGGAVSSESAEEVAIVGEVDRVYLDSPSKLLLRGCGTDGKGVLMLSKTASFPDLVLWNLGEAKAPSMADLGDGEWRNYVCLEAGAVGKKVSVLPGHVFSAAQTFEMQ